MGKCVLRVLYCLGGNQNVLGNRGYFEVQEHETKTRNNQCLLKLPRIKTEYARKSFRFMGAKFITKCLLKSERLNPSATTVIQSSQETF